MNVLVWQSYGNVRCFAANTIPQLQWIVTEVGVTMTGWGFDTELMELISLIAKMEPNVARRNISSTVNRLGRGHESFETFEFTDVQGA